MSEQDSTLVRTIVIVIGGLFVFMIVIMVAAKMIVGDRNDPSADPTVQAKIEKQIEPVGKIEITGVAQAPAAAGAKIDGQQIYQASCFACHGTGAAGAPKSGDKGAWKARIAQGNKTLYDHAIKGYQGKAGMMPPKGGSTQSDEAVKAAVDFMVAQSK